MANKIDNIDIGTVTLVSQVTKEETINIDSGGQRHRAVQAIEQNEWRVDGFLVDPSYNTLHTLKNIANHKQLVFVDCESSSYLPIGYGKVTDLQLDESEAEAGIITYTVTLAMMAVIGNTRVLTSEAWLIDSYYRVKLKDALPDLGAYNGYFSANRLEYTYQIYVANYKSSSQQAVIEVMVGDDVDYVEVDEYSAGSWTNKGKWGTGGTAWAGTANNYTVDKGYRGDVKTIGTITRSLGTWQRLLIRTPFLDAGNVVHYYNAYTTYQRWIRIHVVHTARDAQRPYPQITWIDGSNNATGGVP